MSTIKEIEAAIEQLPAPEVDALVSWLEQLRIRRGAAVPVERWLERARGAGRAGVTTAGIMALTRGEE
jgi:hypothetical protein